MQQDAIDRLREIISAELEEISSRKSLSAEIQKIDETIEQIDSVLSYLHVKLIEDEDWTSTPFQDLFKDYKDLIDSKVSLLKLKQEMSSSKRIDLERLAETLRKISNIELLSGETGAFDLSKILEEKV